MMTPLLFWTSLFPWTERGEVAHHEAVFQDAGETFLQVLGRYPAQEALLASRISVDSQHPGVLDALSSCEKGPVPPDGDDQVLSSDVGSGEAIPRPEGRGNAMPPEQLPERGEHLARLEMHHED
ncbi:hypothetical protein J4439_06490 [Candidatus Woesearchaeota archaeon]|nr:hypothetical protein [Candidatus Woesearchaeota archaeon]